MDIIEFLNFFDWALSIETTPITENYSPHEHSSNNKRLKVFSSSPREQQDSHHTNEIIFEGLSCFLVLGDICAINSGQDLFALETTIFIRNSCLFFQWKVDNMNVSTKIKHQDVLYMRKSRPRNFDSTSYISFDFGKVQIRIWQIKNNNTNSSPLYVLKRLKEKLSREEQPCDTDETILSMKNHQIKPRATCYDLDAKKLVEALSLALDELEKPRENEKQQNHFYQELLDIVRLVKFTSSSSSNVSL